MRVTRRSLSAASVSLAAAALIFAACTDRDSNPVGPGGPPVVQPPQGPDAVAMIECQGDIVKQTVTCGPPTAASGARLDRIFLGSQGVKIRLISSNISNLANVFAFDVRVVNLLPQAIGTIDGVTADPVGSRVFFYDGLHTTGGSGEVTVQNPDGLDMFTASNQPFFQYTGVLAPRDTTPAKRWELHYDSGVTSFAFTLFVQTSVRYPQGVIILTPPATTLDVGAKDTLVGYPTEAHGDTLATPITSWVSSDSSKVSVVQISPNSAEITGVAFGSATITASQSSGDTVPFQTRSGSATVVVNNTPLSTTDTFPAFENVTISRPAAKGLLRKWSDPDSETLSVTPGTFATWAGGTAVVSANGSFTYLSAPGYTGNDSLHYTVTDGVNKVNAVALVQVANTHVWYVQPAATGLHDGRDQQPFATITAAQAVAVAGDSILVLANGVNQVNDGAVLKNGQALLGQGIPASIVYTTADAVGVTVLAAGSAPGIARTDAGAAVTLAPNNTIRGVGITAANGAAVFGSGFGTLTASDLGVNPAGPALDLTNGTLAANFTTLSSTGSSTTGLRLNGVGGTLNAAGGAISNAAVTAVDVTGGTVTLNYPGNITNTAGRAVSVSSITGGAITLTGTITNSGTGISVTNNTGGTIAFDGTSKSLNTGANPAVTVTSNTGATVSFGGGGLAIGTTTGAGFTASGGGTVSVTGAGNTVSSTTGTAVALNGVSTGAGGVNLVSVSANGAANGISLTSVTGNGFQVTGDGSNGGSGGAIQNTTGHSVALSTLTGTPVLLKFLNVTGAGTGGNAGIFASAADSVVAASVVVSAAGGPALSFTGSHLSGSFTSLSSSGSASSGVILTNGAGTFTAAGGTISNATGTGFAVSGGSQSATFSGSISQTANNASLVSVSGGHTGTLTFDTGTLSATTGNGVQLNNADGGYAFNGTTTLNGGDAGVDVLNGSGGTFSFAAGASITSPSGVALFVDASAPTLTYAGSITTSPAAGRPVQVQGVTGGSVNVSGPVGSTGQGILVQNNTGGSTTFSGSKTLNTATNAAVTLATNAGHAVAFTNGGLSITTTTGTGFAATGSGTFTVTGSGNNIGTGAGAAISLANVTVGAAGMGLGTVSSSGTPNAVSLTNVTGTGAITTTGGTLTGVAAGATFLVSGGSANVTWSGAITQGAANALLSVSAGHTGTLTFQTGTLQATAGTGLQFSNADGSYAFNGTTTLNGGDAGIDVLAGSAGAFTFASGTAITNPSGAALNVANSASATNVSYAGSIATNASRAVVVDGMSSGSVTVSGSVTSTGTGILVQNNTGGTVTFSGSTKTLNTGGNAAVTLTSNTGASVLFSGGNLDIDTNGATGFNSSGGGTLQITGSNNSINSVNGTALIVNGLTIGASGLSFVRIDASNGANGIFLSNTGSNGLQVTGTAGTNGSGGSIVNTSGADGATAGNGVYLSSAQNVNLSWMAFSGHANHAIYGKEVTGFTLNRTRITGTNGSSTATDDGSIGFDNLYGSASITSSYIDGGFEDNVRVVNGLTAAAASLNRLTMTSDTVGFNGSTGNDGVLVAGYGTAVVNATIQNSRFTGSRANNIAYAISENASGNIVVTGNTITNTHPSKLGSDFGIYISHASTGAVTYQVATNSVNNAGGSGIEVDRLAGGNGAMGGSVTGNTVGTAGVAGSGSAAGAAIFIGMVGSSALGSGAVHVDTVSGNTVRQFGNYGIRVANRGTGTNYLSVQVKNNNIAEPYNTASTLFPSSGMRFEMGATSGPPADDGKSCFDISGNTVTNSGTNGGPEIRLFGRFSSKTGLPGLTGAGANALIQGQNTIVTSGTAVNATSTNAFQSTCPPV